MLSSIAAVGPVAASPNYAWYAAEQDPDRLRTLAGQVPPPPGFNRIEAGPKSFASWLRGLPMKPAGSPVLLFTGVNKPRQDVHAAVVDIDIGRRDLQQCADAIMRLRAEWLWATGRQSEIGFNDTDGRRRAWSRTGKSDYTGFRKYLDLVFAYAGTYSLERELRSVDPAEISIGDVFIKGGFPGHAVLVADVAVDGRGERRFLLLQSYMPAQDIHVLRNPSAADGSPWYAAPVAFPFITPEWTFPAGSLKRWP